MSDICTTVVGISVTMNNDNDKKNILVQVKRF